MTMLKRYYDQDADLSLLQDKTVAVFGYGSQGEAQAKNMRDSGLKVVVGVRPAGPSAETAKADGFEVLDFAEAAARAELLHFLLPDEIHEEIYNRIQEHVTPGKILCCSHGLSFHFGLITPPQGVDVIMMAPKGQGLTVRSEYLRGSGVPSLVAVHADASGKAMQYALAIAKANGATKCACFESTFKDETETDLFGEQNIICGGAMSLVKTGFEVLTEAGYPPEIAYFECLHELKLIVDLIHRQGIHGMAEKISNTARYGLFSQGPNVITEETKRAMQRQLERIQNGEFVQEWIQEESRENSSANLDRMTAECREWPVEQAGREIRKIIGLEEPTTGEEK
jgi:ketol-acid reductoisomerase